MALTWPELLERLAEPFPVEAVSWRAGSVSRDKKRAQALPYAEPRVYEDRLNALCPGLWSVAFRPWGESRIICELTLGAEGEDGALTYSTRASTGEENDGFAPGTAAEAQAFKRACSKFGLGRYLYDIPISWMDYDDASRKLLATPSLPKRFLPEPPHAARAQRAPAQAEGARLLPPPAPTAASPEVPAPAPTLSPTRADAMYRELEKLGFTRSAQHELAKSVLQHEVAAFAELSESEALEVWNAAKRAQAPRRAVGF